MLAPAIPADEAERLAILRGLALLDTAPEERFDRLVRLARNIFQVPIALISLIDVNRQWFKSCFGLDAAETSREISFCGHAILGRGIFYIPDALADARFADNPLVTGDPHIRFYVGAPLRVNGSAIGTLCMIDRRPRQLTDEQMGLLRDVADAIEQQLTLHNALESARQLTAQSIRLHTILASVGDGIMVMDTSGIIESANPAADTLFGYPHGSLVGEHVHDLIPDHPVEDYGRYLADFRRNGVQVPGRQGHELIGRRRDTSTFPIELTISRMVIDSRPLVACIVRDISERKLAEHRLREVDQQRQMILDSAGAGIISVSDTGIIQTFSKGAELMFGYKAHEVVGRQTPALLHDPDEVLARNRLLAAELGQPVNAGFDTFTLKARLTGEPTTCEWTYIRKDGTRFPGQVTISPMRDDNGAISGFMGISTDISERKHLDRMKSEFVSTVSHELRTPLTAIRGALGLVLGKASDGLSPKAKQLLETANRNSERLTLLINDILDLEKIVAGGMDFRLQPTDLVVLAQQAIQANESFAERHQVRLCLEASPASAMVQADGHRLMQVLTNLISNAVKFSSTGGVVELAITLQGKCWRVSVVDHGRGIPDAFRQTVFQRFAQADSSNTREQGGTGLGLSICKAIMDRHNGYIGYHSVLGKGTEFFFELAIHSRSVSGNPEQPE